MLKYTRTLIDKLNALHEQRIERALSLMDMPSQRVFQLLPVLLHYHHPELPGYSASTTPQGVSQFECSPEQLRLLNGLFESQSGSVTESLTQEIDSLESREILGLYAMGSTGSVGQSTSSDLDVWVCIRSEMPLEKRMALTGKCLQLTQWAQSLGVEAHFFLMDETRFREKASEDFEGENCGSTQNLLLLDEFYRSAVRIAGQGLLWQIVPPEMEACYDEYTQSLFDEGYIDPQEWIDFGPLSDIPAEEYFGSNLWQLYKSIDSPYKSVLKAILLESYSWEYPSPQLLSIEAKRRFFSYEQKSYGMDSYYLMLVKVTRYLERIGDQTRLDLVRRCFYLKTHEKLSRLPAENFVEWRHQVIKDLVQEWGWSAKIIQELDNRRYWKVELVKKVHQDLLDALMLSYRQLIQFARKHNITSAISPQDISILARKLYASFETLPGKITLLNAQISPDLHEPFLSFVHVAQSNVNDVGWYLYKHPLEPKEMITAKSLEHYPYLSKLVAWAFFNGLITESTHLDVLARSTGFEIDKLYQMVSDLRNTFSLRKRLPSMQALSSPCEVDQLSIFINLEQDATELLDDADLNVKNAFEVDVFQFGQDKQCLVSSIDLVFRNTWHEVRTLHFRGDDAMINALQRILGKMHQDALPPDSIDVFCYSKHFRGLMRNTVYQVLSECIDLRLKPMEEDRGQRYKVIDLAEHRYGLFFERRGVTVSKLDSGVDFYASISNKKLQNAPMGNVVDDMPQIRPPIIVDTYASEGLVQFFFEDDDLGFNIYVLDENNQVEFYRQVDGTKDDVIRNINHFYATDTHGMNTDHALNFNLPQYYQVVNDTDGTSRIEPYRSEVV